MNPRQHLEDKIADANNLISEIKQFKQRLTQPAWITAIEEHVALVKMLDLAVRNIKARNLEGKMYDSFEPDLMALRGAETFSFAGAAREAIFQAATSVPDDSYMPLLSVPGVGVGFWYFDKPLPIPTMDRNVGIRALLYRYHLTVKTREEHAKTVLMRINADMPLPTAMVFSAFVDDVDAENDNHIRALHPSTTFKWDLNLTIDQMVNDVRREYDYNYFAGQLSGEFQPSPESRIRTLTACRSIAKFFTAACTWMEQEIVVSTPSDPLPRTRRRQIEREAKLSNPPSVKVIALRKQHAESREATDSDESTGRDWQHQWVVSGHWRHQPYGPGRSQKKLIYINPFLKGPEGKPLMPERKKVFAVVR